LSISTLAVSLGPRVSVPNGKHPMIRGRSHGWRKYSVLAAVFIVLAAQAWPVSAASLDFAPPVGLVVETVDQTRFATTIIRPDKVLTQTIETGVRQVGRVVDAGDGQVRIGYQPVKAVLKVNGKARPELPPGVGAAVVHVYSPRGELLRTTADDSLQGDLRELAVSIPAGSFKKGTRWKQDFRLQGGPDAPPMVIKADWEVVGLSKVLGREAIEVRGTLSTGREVSASKLWSVLGEGTASAYLEARTGVSLGKSLKFHVEQVREDPVSMAFVKAGGKKLGYYLDLTRQQKAAYFGTGAPPSFSGGAK
ncbi:MAG: hypothetical protein FD129_2199, partial [bacterium]